MVMSSAFVIVALEYDDKREMAMEPAKSFSSLKSDLEIRNISIEGPGWEGRSVGLIPRKTRIRMPTHPTSL